MGRTKTLALAPVFIAILGACVTVSFGRKFDTAHVSDIRPCVTTEGELLAWFGEPYERGNADGLPTLHWLHSSNGPSGWNSSALVAVVNRAGKVVHFQFNPTGVGIEAKDVCGGAGDASAP
jgi:hypothetical protein